MPKDKNHIHVSVGLADNLGALADKTEDVAQGLECMRAALENDGIDGDGYIRGQVNILLAVAEDASTKAARLNAEAERALEAIR